MCTFDNYLNFSIRNHKYQYFKLGFLVQNNHLKEIINNHLVFEKQDLNNDIKDFRYTQDIALHILAYHYINKTIIYAHC